MSINGISGGLSYFHMAGRTGKIVSAMTAGCRSVYEAEPWAVIQKEEDRIVSKTHYTEEDALWNQYGKQYRDSMKIVDGKVVVTGEPWNYLAKSVPEEELEAYRQKLEQEGLGDGIDWRGVESDFRNMEVDFSNAEHLNTKIDYIASRCAVLRERIEQNSSGEEKEQQLSRLEAVMDRTKQTLVDSYSDSIGNFYEEYGYSGAKKELAQSLSSGIDQRIAQYEEHLRQSDTYAALREETAGWLQQDDGYMAARLREDLTAQDGASRQTEAAGHTLHDLETAGLYAAECRERLDKQGAFWSDNEQRMGLDLAVQGMKTDYLAGHGGLSRNMQDLLQDTFQNYKRKYTDLLEQKLREDAAKFSTPLKNRLDRGEISAVYEYTMAQYRQSGDILDAFAKGAKQAQSAFERNFSQRAGATGNYLDKYKWDRFFDRSKYTGIKGEDCMYEKYRKSIDRFLGSLEAGGSTTVKLLFGSSGDYEMNVFA